MASHASPSAEVIQPRPLSPSLPALDSSSRSTAITLFVLAAISGTSLIGLGTFALFNAHIFSIVTMNGAIAMISSGGLLTPLFGTFAVIKLQESASSPKRLPCEEDIDEGSYPEQAPLPADCEEGGRLHGFELSEDGKTFKVAGDGNCSLYSALAARLKFENPNLDLNDINTQNKIYWSAVRTRENCVQWLSKQLGENDFETVSVMLNPMYNELFTRIEKLQGDQARVNRLLSQDLANKPLSRQLDAIQAELVRRQKQSQDASNLLLSEKPLNKDNWAPLPDEQKKAIIDLCQDYLSIIREDKKFCGPVMHYALSNRWRCEIQVFDEHHQLLAHCSYRPTVEVLAILSVLYDDRRHHYDTLLQL